MVAYVAQVVTMYPYSRSTAAGPRAWSLPAVTLS